MVLLLLLSPVVLPLWLSISIVGNVGGSEGGKGGGKGGGERTLFDEFELDEVGLVNSSPLGGGVGLGDVICACLLAANSEIVESLECWDNLFKSWFLRFSSDNWALHWACLSFKPCNKFMIIDLIAGKYWSKTFIEAFSLNALSKWYLNWSGIVIKSDISILTLPKAATAALKSFPNFT